MLVPRSCFALPGVRAFIRLTRVRIRVDSYAVWEHDTRKRLIVPRLRIGVTVRARVS